MDIIRKTGRRDELAALWKRIASLNLLLGFSTFSAAAIGNGTTSGRLRTNAAVNYRVAGVEYSKASTDDLWDLSAETATDASSYRAYWLYLDSAGASSFVAGGDKGSAALALADLPDVVETKSILGVFVAGPSTNFANALAAQGTIYDGIPAGAAIGVPGQVYAAPEGLSLIPA